MHGRAAVRTAVLLLAVAAVGAAGLRWAAARASGSTPTPLSILIARRPRRGVGYNSSLFKYLRPISAEDYVREAVARAASSPPVHITFRLIRLFWPF